MLNDDLVKDAIEAVINTHQITITEEPSIVLVYSEVREKKDESTEVSTVSVTRVNSLKIYFVSQ